MSGTTITVQVKHFTKFAVFAIKKITENPVLILSDISGHWAKDSINDLVSIGAINGYPDGRFIPENKMTRAEFAAVAYSARSSYYFAHKPTDPSLHFDPSVHVVPDNLAPVRTTRKRLAPVKFALVKLAFVSHAKDR